MTTTHWLLNPLSNQGFVPFSLLLLGMFGLAALALLCFHYAMHVVGHGRTLTNKVSSMQRVLWQRYCTWLLIAVLFVGAAFSGALATAVLCGFLCWQGGCEYAVLTHLAHWQRNLLILAGWFSMGGMVLWGATFLLFVPILAFFGWSVLALYPVAGSEEMGERFRMLVTGFWGNLYLGWLPVHLLALSMGKFPGLLLLVGLGVALSDIGAFCVGKVCGGPRLAPHLSPGKTWSGVLGNIVGAALALGLTASVLPGIQLWQSALLALAIGLGSVWGDLLESLLKRQYGAKDAGTLLPGFGGLLDRIDSLLIVAPLVYYLSLHIL